MSEQFRNDEAESMSEATILGAIHTIHARITKAETQRAELERLIAVAKEEEQLLKRLLALRRGENEKADGGKPPHGQSGVMNNAAGELNHPVVAAVVAELEQAGRPLHISDLMRLLHERDIPIPGLGTQANLISYLRRDTRLVRPSRGMYALATSGLMDASTQVKRHRRRRRMRSTARNGGKQG